MKKLIPLFVLSFLAISIACVKNDISEELLPNVDVQNIIPDGTELDESSKEAFVEKVRTLNADFSIETNDGTVDEKATLIITNNSVNAVSYEWDFGNGQTSTEANPSHSYTIHGNYDVTLKVTDAFGNTKEISQPITVLCLYGGGNHNG